MTPDAMLKERELYEQLHAIFDSVLRCYKELHKVDLSRVPDEELQREIEMRKLRVDEPMPQILGKLDFTNLVTLIVEGFNKANIEGYFDDDLKGYIYEAAVEAVYGKSFWEWRKKQKW